MVGNSDGSEPGIRYSSGRNERQPRPHLENMQLEPDIKVTNDPASAMKGRDLQLEAAVESLMKEIK